MIYGYLSGKISAQEFIAAARQNPEIPLWFQTIIPDEATHIDHPYISYHIDSTGRSIYQLASSSHPFWNDVYYGTCFNVLRERIDMGEYFRLTDDFDTPDGRLNAYVFLHSLAAKKDPNIPKTERYSKEFGFYLGVCSDNFEGHEIRLFLDQLIFGIYYSDQITRGKKQLAKQKVKEALHISGRHRPRWIQAPEWPMGTNSPMEFITQKQTGDLVQYTFRDVDTGETRVIEQYY